MKIVLVLVIILFIFSFGCTDNFQEDISTNDETTKNDISTDKQSFIVTEITNELRSPWGMEFIDENKLIVTQKQGIVSIVDTRTGKITNLEGVPQVNSSGQGGMLDVALKDDWIYLTYSANYDNGVTTHLARGKLNKNNYSIENLEVLYRALPARSGGAHFGSRVIVKEDYVFFSVGDRGDKQFNQNHVSQDTTNDLGKIIRLHLDGRVPKDNPFINDENVLDSIYTFGHRNVQGMTINPFTKEIWISEHGEQDGDSINILKAGGNYGWPLVHYGCHYLTGLPIGGVHHENPEFINPVYYWECGSGGFPPAGMTFYDGNVFETWKGDLFVGNLRYQYLGHFKVNNGEVKELEPLLKNKGWRIRDVTQSPAGYLYVIVDASPGGLYRIEPN